MPLKYPTLFSPFKIGNLEVKNRICMSAMDTAGWYDSNGLLTDAGINYYEARAKGGVGLIHTGSNRPNFDFAGGGTNTASPFKDAKAFVFMHKKLADRVHAYGTKLFIQLSYGGGRVAFPASLQGGGVAASAGPNRWDSSIMCREITRDEITGIINASVEAALLCQKSGCDGVNINAYGGYLLDQFITARFNHRSDEYGGSVEGRAKILTDIVTGIKEACGQSFPVTVRIGTKQYMKGVGQGIIDGESYEEYGRDVDESIAIAKVLQAAGCDGFLIGNGTYDSFYWLYPPMYQKEALWLDDVAPLTAALDVPVISSGKILRPEVAEQAISDGKITAAALGRALIADLEWAAKARRGDAGDIRPCIGCNNGCIGHIFTGQPLQCAVNADVMREGCGGLVKAETPKRVAVIGAGIAGMECARVAALRGHTVTIYEESDRVGGMFNAAAAPDFKYQDRWLISWYERQLSKLGVRIEYKIKITPEKLREIGPDEVVVSTGSYVKMPPIPGIDGANVASGVDVLLGNRDVGDSVIVIGGGHVGCEVALFLKEKGKEVSIVEAAGSILSAESPEPMSIANKLMLIDSLAFNGIQTFTNMKVTEIHGDGLSAIHDGTPVTLHADSVVVAIGLRSNSGLYDTLNREFDGPVWLIGDAKQVSNTMFGIRDANAVARIL